ncbi:hypothetical protein BCR44DRAFT_411053 [Catenaria anguillulae PL171]|uniref:Uncharacterized protein n=1 Tax=Catenaria anguillulae PL171 TaxID=765915 RepID=A0A1Y2HH30_9FUNG|nr:hypothetical protein BCR44DRAFT_411053 [Catenaria anguillulae PL171]
MDRRPCKFSMQRRHTRIAHDMWAIHHTRMDGIEALDRQVGAATVSNLCNPAQTPNCFVFSKLKMAQVASCPCANVSLLLTEGPDKSFHVQDDPRLHLEGHQATALPHSLKVTHPHLTSILDPDHCRLKWLVCGNCLPPHVVYGVENDDEQALSHNLLLPLDHKLVLTQHVLVGADAEALPKSHPRFSPLYKVVVPTSRSFGPEVPGTELTPELRTVLTQLDATYSAHVAKETAAMEARIATFRDAELANLKALDARVAEERDCLFAAAVRLRRGVTLDDNGSPPNAPPPASSRTAVTNGTRSGLLPSSVGVSASANASSATSPDPSRPATAATAMNPTLDVQLSASFRPAATTTAMTGGASDLERESSQPSRANRPRQRTLTGGVPTASASADTNSVADGDMFLFDDEIASPPSPPLHEARAASSETAASASSDMESDVDDSPTPAAAHHFGTSLPMSIPPVLTPSTGRSRQPTVDPPQPAHISLVMAPPPAPVPHTPVPSGSPPAPVGAVPVGDGTSDEDLGDLDSIGHALPPHAYLARTYAAPPGVLVVGSKPAGAGERGFSFRG